MAKTYRFFCSHCNWRLIADGDSPEFQKLHEIKRSKIQRNLPKLDRQSKKLVVTKFKNQPRKFRCPECGHSAVPHVLGNNPQAELDRKLEEERRKEEMERIRNLEAAAAKERYLERAEAEEKAAAEAAEARAIQREVMRKRQEERFAIESQESRTDASEGGSEGQSIPGASTGDNEEGGSDIPPESGLSV